MYAQTVQNYTVLPILWKHYLMNYWKHGT